MTDFLFYFVSLTLKNVIKQTLNFFHIGAHIFKYLEYILFKSLFSCKHVVINHFYIETNCLPFLSSNLYVF